MRCLYNYHDLTQLVLDEIMVFLEVDKAELANYLTKLKPYLQKLRFNYKEQSAPQYNTLQEIIAYFLCYYPGYVLTLDNIINTYIDPRDYENYQGQPLTILINGGGPLPEVIGLASLINSIRPRQIDYAVYDRVAYWRSFWDITKNIMSRFGDKAYSNYLLFNCAFEKTCNQCSKEQMCLDKKSSASLIIAQNCVTEFTNQVNLERYKQKLHQQFNLLKRKGKLIVVDRACNFSQKAIDDIKHSFVTKRVAHEIAADKGYLRVNTYDIPNILLSNLYQDENGLIPRNNYYYTFFILEKN